MDDVLYQVAISFEEDGVNHSVLDELKKVGSNKAFHFAFTLLRRCHESIFSPLLRASRLYRCHD